MSEIEIRKSVKKRYAKLATSEPNCGSYECCCNQESHASDGLVPIEAALVSAGCGSPLLLIAPKQGDTVLDLGSGGGVDVFRASLMVGPNGRAIGVDATPEMVWKARETKAKYGSKYSNTEFLLGEIERLPVEPNSVDFVVSNCVINLSPNKPAVFQEAFRVLKEGGEFAVADVTLDSEIPEDAKKDLTSWAACTVGALTDSEYTKLLLYAGFRDVKVEHIESFSVGKHLFKYYRSHIKARKKQRPSSAGSTATDLRASALTNDRLDES
jgi:arsenite methyltransferase